MNGLSNSPRYAQGGGIRPFIYGISMNGVRNADCEVGGHAFKSSFIHVKIKIRWMFGKPCDLARACVPTVTLLPMGLRKGIPSQIMIVSRSEQHHETIIFGSYTYFCHQRSVSLR